MSIKIYNSDSYDVINVPRGYRGIKNDYLHRFLTFRGIPILAPGDIDDFAIQEARWVMSKMFQTAEYRVPDMYATNLFITILPDQKGGIFDFELDTARIIVVGEDNLVDRDAQTSILIHEVAHALHYSLCNHEKTHIKTLYESRPYWGRDDAYAQQDEFEYFAEGVAAYFSAGMSHEIVNKRSILQTFDPPLYSTIDAIFERNHWLWQPINKRTILSEHTFTLEAQPPSKPLLKEYHERR